MPVDRKVALLDPDDVIEELGLTDQDFRRVQRLLTVASARLERRCQTTFALRTEVRTFDGNATPILDVGSPFVAVNWATIDGAVEDRANYIEDGPAGRLIRPATWPAGFRNLRVDALYGMDPVPPEVREAAMLLVRRLAFPALGMRSERIGDYAYERFDERGEADLPDDVEALVLPFVRLRF